MVGDNIAVPAWCIRASEVQIHLSYTKIQRTIINIVITSATENNVRSRKLYLLLSNACRKISTKLLEIKIKSF